MFDAIKMLIKIARHPLNRRSVATAVGRWLKWHISARISLGPTVVPFVNQTRLVAKKGMTAATLNIYFGLAEFNDMFFLMHYLRKGDLFIDIGANIGSYTILAAGVSKSRVMSIEPVPQTFESLRDNVQINRLSGDVELHCCVLGDSTSELHFIIDSDATNHVVPGKERGVVLPVRRLDDIVKGRCPSLVKIDVEGFEAKVLNGATETLKCPGAAFIIELNGLSRRYGIEPSDTVSLLREYAFSPFRYNAVERILDPCPETINEYHGNYIFIKDIECVKNRLKEACPVNVNGIIL